MADPDDSIATIPEMLKYRAEEGDGDRRTFRFYDRNGFLTELTPRYVYNLAGKFAFLLRSWGFKQGEVIANGLPNCPERVITDFGIIMSGCVLANCQVIEKAGGDFWHTANISGCTGVIISARPDDAPNRIFSPFLSSLSTSSSSSSSSSSLQSGSNDSTLTLDDMIRDVTIGPAPNIRKIIICDRNPTIATDRTKTKVGQNLNDESLSGSSSIQNREQFRREKGNESLSTSTNANKKTADEKIENEKQVHDNSSCSGFFSTFLDRIQGLDNVRQFYRADCNASDLAVLLGTSGSTGFNKLVPVTHESILTTGRSFGKKGRDILIYNDRPVGWIGGFAFDFLASGACRVLQDSYKNESTSNARELWSVVTESGCHGMSLMPNDIMALVSEFESHPPENKFWFIATGGQSTRKELSRALGVLCNTLVISYGCSEGGVFTIGVITDPQQLDDFYCGRITGEDVQIKIVDDEGKELEKGVAGEIYVKYDRIIKAYYDVSVSSTASKPQPELHTEDGWYKTGDRGMMDDNGRLYCYGRRGDVTFVNGVLIYLSWLESILSKCPGVQNCSVIAVDDGDGGSCGGGRNDDGDGGSCGGGRKDDDFGGRKNKNDTDGTNRSAENSGVIFCGFVESGPDSNLTEDGVKKFFADGLMDTAHKDGVKLKLSHVFFVDTLPLIPSRKVNKRALMEIAKEKLHF